MVWASCSWSSDRNFTEFRRLTKFAAANSANSEGGIALELVSPTVPNLPNHSVFAEYCFLFGKAEKTENSVNFNVYKRPVFHRFLCLAEFAEYKFGEFRRRYNFGSHFTDCSEFAESFRFCQICRFRICRGKISVTHLYSSLQKSRRCDNNDDEKISSPSNTILLHFLNRFRQNFDGIDDVSLSLFLSLSLSLSITHTHTQG